MSLVDYAHIKSIDGVPMIAGTRTKVVHVAIDRLAHNWDADEIRRQRPHLSLGQIYSALAYYYDHEDEINRDIQDRLRREEELIAKIGTSPIRLKLQALKRSK